MPAHSRYWTSKDEFGGYRDMTEAEKDLTDEYYAKLNSWYKFRAVLPDKLQQDLQEFNLFDWAKDMVRYHNDTVIKELQRYTKLAGEYYLSDKANNIRRFLFPYLMCIEDDSICKHYKNELTNTYWRDSCKSLDDRIKEFEQLQAFKRDSQIKRRR